jgi:hypothetical protein
MLAPYKSASNDILANFMAPMMWSIESYGQIPSCDRRSMTCMHWVSKELRSIYIHLAFMPLFIWTVCTSTLSKPTPTSF